MVQLPKRHPDQDESLDDGPAVGCGSETFGAGSEEDFTVSVQSLLTFNISNQLVALGNII